MRLKRKITVALLALLFTLPGIAEKLKTYYSGSAQTAEGASRLIMLQFAQDGTAVLQQDDDGQPSVKQHVHWSKKGDRVILTFDAVEGQPTPLPLYFLMKNNTLVPQTENATGLSVLGYPTLQPFGNE
jgi:hypothetical protein